MASSIPQYLIRLTGSTLWQMMEETLSATASEAGYYTKAKLLSVTVTLPSASLYLKTSPTTMILAGSVCMPAVVMMMQEDPSAG